MPLIDIESFVFSAVATELRGTFDGIWVSGEYVDVPASFPAVTIIEVSNTVLSRMTTTAIENATSVGYEVNVYTNRVGYKKSDAKDIMEVVDREFTRLGFTRVMMNPVSNLQEATIYRIVVRYEGVVMVESDVNDIIYRIYTS